MFRAMRIEGPNLTAGQRCQYWKTSFGTGEPKACGQVSSNIIILFNAHDGNTTHSTSFLCNDHADLMTEDMERERVNVDCFHMSRGSAPRAHKE